MTKEADKLWDMADDARECMMVDKFSGGMRARPMAPIVKRDENAIWFVTDKDSGKVDEVRANPEVCLAISSGSDYVSITGDAQVVHDMAKLKEVWNPFIDAWFPDGPEGGNATLLKITPKMGEYWDSPSSIVSTVKMLVASATDQRPDLGENEKVTL